MYQRWVYRLNIKQSLIGIKFGIHVKNM